MEFYAKIQKREGTFLVSFPDLPNVNTYGETLTDALKQAEEALNGSLESDFERGFSIPISKNYSTKKSYHPIRVLPHIEIAYELKRLRKGFTQIQIAEKLGITYQSYQKLENPRKCNPTIKMLERISDVLQKKLVVSFRN